MTDALKAFKDGLLAELKVLLQNRLAILLAGLLGSSHVGGLAGGALDAVRGVLGSVGLGG